VSGEFFGVLCRDEYCVLNGRLWHKQKWFAKNDCQNLLWLCLVMVHVCI